MTARTVFFSAGEASGDRLAAGLVRELARRRPDWRLTGIGGPAMAAAGCDCRLDIRRTAAIGISESLRVLPAALLALVRARRLLARLRPDVFVAVDCQGINLVLAKIARRQGCRVVYFVPPQNFLWNDLRRGREIARRVDLFLNIYRQGHEFYSSLGARSVFCGHPLVHPGRIPDRRPAPARGNRLVVLAAGSRPRELARFVPLLAAAARILARDCPGLVFATPATDPRHAAHLTAAFSRAGLVVEAVPGPPGPLFARAAAALVKSGTIALEAALAGCPCAVFYRVSRLSWFVMERLWRVGRKLRFVSLPNILSGREVVREFLQRTATPATLAGALHALLDDPVERRRRLALLTRFRAGLASGRLRPEARAAGALIAVAENGKRQ